MNKKILLPLKKHIFLCIVCYLIFRLTWGGPEGGVLFQYFPKIEGEIVYIITCIIQIVIIYIYFNIGKSISSLSKVSLLSIFSVCIFNIICILIICLFGYNLQSSIKIFTVFGGAPFFLLSLVGEMNIITNIINIFLPSAIIFIGNIYGYLLNLKNKD